MTAADGADGSESGPDSGLLLVDKGTGMTSFEAVRRVRRALGGIRAGHAGSLDPFATGLLPVLVGRATRLVRFVALGAKRYRASIHFGQATDTDDHTGRPVGGRTSLPSESEIRAVLHEFVGEIEQRPPVYSAKHIGGQRAYRLARAGRKVTLPPVRVKVHALSLVGFEAGTARIACQVGPGTYIRALARDLGERLGGAAHLCALRRTAVGPFRVEAAGRLAELSDPAAARARLLGPLEALAGLPRHLVSRDQATALGHGRRLPLRCRDCRPGIGSGDGDAFRVAWTRAEGETRERLVAVIRATSDGWRPVVVWSRPRLCRS